MRSMSSARSHPVSLCTHIVATAFRPGQSGGSMTHLVVRAIVVMVTLAVTGMQMPAHARSTRVVPTDYPTIQAAIDAAQAGDAITVLAGTYTEQLRISKDLEIVGAGVKSTIIRAPSRLRQGK